VKRKNLTKRQKPWRAIGVARVSAEGQRDNTSHEVQHDAIARFCDHEGFDLLETLNEVASGTGYETRVQTQVAIEMIERDEVDVLVMYDVSRYGRDLEFQHKILKRILSAGGRLQFALFRLDYDDRTGELTPESLQMLSFMGVGAAAELAYIRRRMEQGKEKKRDEGLQMARSIHPFGWRVVTKTDVLRGLYPAQNIGRYEPVAEQLRHVKPLIFEAYAGGMSLRDICTTLQEQNIPTPRGAALWAPGSVRVILQSPLYTGRPARRRTYSKRSGRLTPKGLASIEIESVPIGELEYLQAPWMREHFARPDIAPFLVPESLYWQCYALLESNRTRLSGAKRNRKALASLVCCPLCGSRMMSKTLRTTQGNVPVYGRLIYVCSAHHDLHKICAPRCPCPSVYADDLQDAVLEALEAFAISPRLVEALVKEKQRRVVKQGSRPDERAAIEGRLGAIEAEELEVVTDRLAARRVGQGVGVYDTLLARLNSERDVLLAKRAELNASPQNLDLRSDLADKRTQIAAMLDTLRDEKTEGAFKNQVLRLLINHLEPVFDPTFVPSLAFRLSARNSPLRGAKIWLAGAHDLFLTIESGHVSCATV